MFLLWDFLLGEMSGFVIDSGLNLVMILYENEYDSLEVGVGDVDFSLVVLTYFKDFVTSF